MIDRKRNTAFVPVGLLGASAIVLALTVAPVSVTIDDDGVVLAASQAMAKGGNGNGNSGGNGNGNGNSGGNSANAKSGNSFADDGFGPGNSSKAKEKAKGRYDEALAGLRGAPDADDADGDVGSEEATLTDEATEALVAVGWGSGKTYDSTEYKNHGDQVSTYVAIAKAMGYGGGVGSLQANFGSPYLSGEHSSSDLGEILVLEEDAVVEEAAVEGEELVGDEDAVVEEAAVEGEELVGDEDTGGSLHWSEVNLDVDGNGAITKADLEMAMAANAAEESVGEETGDGTTGGEETGDTGTEGEGTDGALIEDGGSAND